MRTSKSLVALLLVLCMAMTFVVPATFAATETIVFDFGNPNATGSYRGQETTLPASPILLRGNATGDNAATNDAYLLNVNSGRGFDIGNSAITFRANATKYWSAIKLCDIKAGTYDLSLSMQMNTSGSGDSIVYAQSNVYIMSYADYAAAFASTNMASVLAVTGETNTGNEDLRLAITDAGKENASFSIKRTADSGDGSTAQKLSMTFDKEDINFPADGDYVLMFRTTTKAAFGASGLQLTREIAEEPVAKIGNAEFASLDLAIAAAQSGDTIELAKNASVDGNITVAAGVTLNLNGKNLTAAQINVDGALVDTGATPGLVTGTIVCTGTNDGYLPLTDGAGYRLYKVNVSSLGKQTVDADSAKFGFHVDFVNNGGYALASSLSMKVTMNWTGGTEQAATAEGAFITRWASAVAADESLDVVVTVTGLTGIDGFALTPSITANGVTIPMSAI